MEDFFGGFATHAGANVHVKVLYGRSSHHKLEAVFKCFARALKYACSKDARLRGELPSTKGLLVIAIFDYGAGNLRSVENTLAEVGAAVYAGARRRGACGPRPRSSCRASGHFGQIMRALDEMEVRGALCERIAAGVPFLGICLGLQALFQGSEEAPGVQGLGLVDGTVRRFPETARVPHMGWNELEAAQARRGCWRA